MELVIFHNFEYGGACYCLVGAFNCHNRCYVNAVFECDDNGRIIRHSSPIVVEEYYTIDEMYEKHKLFLKENSRNERQ